MMTQNHTSENDGYGWWWGGVVNDDVSCQLPCLARLAISASDARTVYAMIQCAWAISAASVECSMNGTHDTAAAAVALGVGGRGKMIACCQASDRTSINRSQQHVEPTY